ncbi:MAG TPA: TPM domain-containing protein [Terrimicrobiaceae bacterium]
MPPILRVKRYPVWRWLPLFVAASARIVSADPLPPKPTQFVSDTAGILSPQTIATLSSRLEAFERDTSNQVIVATFPRVPEGYVLEDFTQRTAEAWGIGQGKDDNGVALFVFPTDRKTRIEVGYGLEGPLPDVVAKRIIENEMLPAFRTGDFDSGVSRGVTAILQATRGEYKGSGRTAADSDEGDQASWIIFLLFLLVILVIIAANRRALERGTYYGPRGRRVVRIPDTGGSWGGGGFGRGSSGGGGGFSGGGGSFGGGGASGSW